MGGLIGQSLQFSMKVGAAHAHLAGKIFGTEVTFISTIRTRQSEWMPFESLAKMSDDELEALWLYLQSLPASETTIK